MCSAVQAAVKSIQRTLNFRYYILYSRISGVFITAISILKFAIVILYASVPLIFLNTLFIVILESVSDNPTG